MEEQTYGSVNYKKRVLKAGDKIEMFEKGQVSFNEGRFEGVSEIRAEGEGPRILQSCRNENDTRDLGEEAQEMIIDDTDDSQNSAETDITELEREARIRRSMKRKEDQIETLENKRLKREVRRYDLQNMEESTPLYNEGEEMNENNRSFLKKYENERESAINYRDFWQRIIGNLEMCQEDTDNNSSNSENRLIIAEELSDETCEEELFGNLSENHATMQSESTDILDADYKSEETPEGETSQEGSDETSTSGESSSNITPKILETPEDAAKKESNVRILGIESPEKAAEGLGHPMAEKEQYADTSKTVIRVPKEKKKDKERSRPPLKMVLKQGRRDGEGDSREYFYIIQKPETSGCGDRNSAANRKLSTNRRHSYDEANGGGAPKDRQSLVIPEKSASSSVHPRRPCVDVCSYCFVKFRPLETPIHLAQMKSNERRKKILNTERHLTKDSCLCDACYRHVDRLANTSPTNMQTKPQKQHRQLMMSNCSARECRDAARHHVKRQWLLKIKAGLQKQVDIDWESSQHTSMSFCASHHSIIERLLSCALCKHRLTRHHIYQLADAETDELNRLHQEQRIPIILAGGSYVCNICRYFTHMQHKYKDVESMDANHKSFLKSYRERVLYYHDIKDLENEDEDSTQNQTKDKDKDKDRRKKAKCNAQPKTGTSKSPDDTTYSVPEKSTPEPANNEGASSEMDNDNRTATVNLNDEDDEMDVQFLGIVTAAEKLEKEKLLDMQPYAMSDAMISCDNPNDDVEILEMDQEVPLTGLPKRPTTNIDIKPIPLILRTPLPGEEERNLGDNTEFTNDPRKTPQRLENFDTERQFGTDAELLWQVQREPYTDLSLLCRHLANLEKYCRSGDFELDPNALRNVINYSTSMQNDLMSYEALQKMKTALTETIVSENSNSRLLSSGYVLERDNYSLPSTSTARQPSSTITSQSLKSSSPPALKLNPGVSVMKEPLPNEHRLNLPSTSANPTNGNVERKDKFSQTQPTSSGSKMFRLSKAHSKRFKIRDNLRQQTLTKIQSRRSNSNSSTNAKSAEQYRKVAARKTAENHQRMQQSSIEADTQDKKIYFNKIILATIILNFINRMERQLNRLKQNLQRQTGLTTSSNSTNTDEDHAAL